MNMKERIGYVVGGTLRSNLRVRLTCKPDTVQEGSFVVIEGTPYLFYSLVTDLQLGSTDPRFADEQFEQRIDPRLAQMLLGQTLYTNIEIMPVLMQETVPDDQLSTGDEITHPIPVKTIPEHHSIVRMAHQGDIEAIFGSVEKKGNFVVGTTREQGLPVCIDLEKFVKRSSGIFGATGTGKSFLTRMILAGLIHENQASVFIFDMHNEYAFDRNDPDTGGRITGLTSKFKGKLQAFGLGPSPMVSGNALSSLMIAESDIEPEDILLLAKELNLRETTDATLNALFSSKGDQWFTFFKELEPGKRIAIDEEGEKTEFAPDSVEGWARDAGIHPEAAKALHTRLRKIFNKPFIIADRQKAQDSLTTIIDYLKNGRHVVLSFGNYESDLDYLLVANILTRRIREAWVNQTNAYNQGHDKPKPRSLVITVEEAHKLMTREMASQTIFSTIAREMRKYFVTLLVVDQRPSQIYDEVMSQLGTRISGWLGDDADISAVLSGLSNKDNLRGMLAHLQEKEEVLLLGWGVPMPLPVRSRRYDDEFWQVLLKNKGKDSSVNDANEADLKAILGF
jgi:uncharacterized protein